MNSNNCIEKLDIKIGKSQEKIDQLKAQKQAALAREKARKKAQDRKDDTRRKILIGEMYLKQMKKDNEFNIHVLNQLDYFLNNQRDRDLFNLPEDYELIENVQVTNHNQSSDYKMLVPEIKLDEYKEAIPNGYKPPKFNFLKNLLLKIFKRENLNEIGKI